jgi:hypothetical protein
MFSDRFSGDGNARVLVFCDATKVFDNETRSSTISQRRRATMMGPTSCWMIGVGDDGALR